MVEQLRGELARVGDHLRTYSDQKQALSAALSAAEARSKRLEEAEKRHVELSATVRDVALALHEPLAAGELALAAHEGKTELNIPRAKLLTSGEVHAGGTKLIAALTKVAALHPKSRIELRPGHARQPSMDDANKPGESTLDTDAGLERLRDAFVAAGVVTDRITIDRGQKSSDALLVVFTTAPD